jgi:uncharacterized membrane protein YhfC
MDVFIHSLNAFVMIGLPISLGVLFVKRLRVEWRLFLVGAVTFVASQIGHLPFNSFVLPGILDRLGFSVQQTGFPLVGAALILGLSAGVFEEGARYLVYRFWLRKERSWREALMFGLGHGGAEAIILGGLATYGLIQAIALRGVDLSSLVPADQVADTAAQLEAYWSMPWYASLLGAVERCFALTIQISLAVLMLQAFTHKQVRWGVAGVLWHTLVDALSVFAFRTWNAYAAEGLVALTAIASLVIIFKLRDINVESLEPDAEPSAEPPPPAKSIPAADADDITAEQVDDSRFV